MNTDFHVAVARASGNARLAATLAQLLDDMERIFTSALKMRDRGVGIELRHDHRPMVEALVSGDAEASAVITAEQVGAAERTVAQALLSSDQLIAVNSVAPAK